MGFMAVWGKNIRVMFNSKLSILILLFGPLILMGITGAALQNTELRDVKASVVAYRSETGDVLQQDWYVESYVEQLQANAFTVVRAESLQQCKQTVLNSDSHVCIEIIKKPPIELPAVDKPQDINYETVAHVDFSQSRIVWGVIAKTQAVSDRHSLLLVQSVFAQFQQELAGPMENLDRSLISVKNVVRRLNTAENKIIGVNNGLKDIRDEYNKLEAAVISLENTLYVVRDDVLAIPELDPTIEDSVLSMASQMTSVKSNLRDLDNNVNSAKFDDLDEAKRGLDSSQRTLQEIEDDIEDVLEEWESIQNLDYGQLSPLSFAYKPVSETGDVGGEVQNRLQFLDYLFPSFLMFFIIFVSLVFSTVTIFKERSSRAHIRNMTSRTSGASFIFGNFLSIFFILCSQITVILGVSVFFLNAGVLGNLVPILFYSFIGVALFVLAGMALGYIFNSQDGAVIASVSLSLLFLIFLPVITSPDTLPPVFAAIVNAMPFLVLESKIRMASIFNIFSIPSVWEFLSIIVSFVICLSLLFYFYIKRKRYEI